MSESSRTVAIFDLPKERSTNLRCVACVDRACEAMGSVEGVLHVDCDSSQARVRVEFDTRRITEDELEARMQRFDLEFDQALSHRAWRVSGLD